LSVKTETVLSRKDLEAIVAGNLPLHRQKSADFAIIAWGAGRAVVKDYRRRSWLWRILGAWLVRQEVRALTALEGRAPVPRLIGAIDRHAFVMELVEGTPCSRLPNEAATPELFVAVDAAIAALHSAGWVHGDLKSFGNMMLQADGTIRLLDLATAFPREGGLGPFRRWMFSQIAGVDRLALAKLKLAMRPDLLTEAERRTLAAPSFAVRVARFYRVIYKRIRGVQ
jgi:hypothetical protein